MIHQYLNRLASQKRAALICHRHNRIYCHFINYILTINRINIRLIQIHKSFLNFFNHQIKFIP